MQRRRQTISGLCFFTLVSTCTPYGMPTKMLEGVPRDGILIFRLFFLLIWDGRGRLWSRDTWAHVVADASRHPWRSPWLTVKKNAQCLINIVHFVHQSILLILFSI